MPLPPLLIQLMNNIPEFLFCENKSALLGAGLILHTQPPFFYGQVLKGLNMEAIVEAAERNKAIAAGKLHNYNIGIIIMGALHSSMYVADKALYAQDSATLARRMCDFYLQEKIQSNTKYYDRYRNDLL